MRGDERCVGGWTYEEMKEVEERGWVRGSQDDKREGDESRGEMRVVEVQEEGRRDGANVDILSPSRNVPGLERRGVRWEDGRGGGGWEDVRDKGGGRKHEKKRESKERERERNNMQNSCCSTKHLHMVQQK